MKAKKIILVGAGAVGCSFLYSAMNRGLASEYGIIDVNKQNVEGQVLDFEDGSAPMDYPFNVFDATYKDCKDADIVVCKGDPLSNTSQIRHVLINGTPME